MHDTAYRIGGLVINTYLPATQARILEIGALDVNGSLRDHSLPNTEYVGLDFEAGKGVDHVITGLNDWNVPDDYFDLVIASSVFEHDPTYWKTFITMCRKAKQGGFVYISAPSNGTVHRYPQDYWRFYPDAGLALEQVARAEGIDLTLIESFIAERENDIWNDFCAVFRIGSNAQQTDYDFVHGKVPVTNVITWHSPLVIDQVNDPEDVRLLHRSLEEGNTLRSEGNTLRSEGEAMRMKLASLTSQVDELSTQNAVLEQRLQDRFKEITNLTAFIQERDKAIAAEHARAEWLRQVLLVLTRGYSRSIKARLGSLLPVWFNKRSHKARLRKQGLFDAADYKAVNPDVARKRVDPLRHYLNRGLAEGRSRGRLGGRGY